jgi:uncharacterized protein (DUF885 family)
MIGIAGFCAAMLGVSAMATAGGEPRLRALLDEHVDFLMLDQPTTASTRGDLRFNDQLRDESPAAYIARRAIWADRLARLEALSTGDAAKSWSEDELVSAEILILELRDNIAAARFFQEQMPMDDRSGPAVWLPQLGERVPMSTRKHREDYVARLEAIPTLLGQQMQQMRAGLEAGRVPPRVTVTRIAQQARAQSRAEIAADPTASAFFMPLAALEATDPLRERAKKAIAGGIVPAFAELADFLEKSYVPAARATIAAGASVDGPALYDHMLREHTTTAMTAQQVHDLGLGEVARIRAEMLRVIARTDFAQRDTLAGDELFAAFIAHLRSEPRFYFTSERELLDAYRVIAKRADPELAKLFGTLPRNPYGIRAIPRFASESSPTAYYYRGSLKAGVPGYFMANTFALDQRPKYEMVALTLHEAMPGHHLQLALADELEGQHPYRQLVGFTAFIEGWALYAERLGLEMEAPIRRSAELTGGTGMYIDPYDDFGRLTYEMWRATRLVVDTGIHALGWSRERAIEYMLANTALSQLNVEREVDRYIAWPGQACAYKVGELKIRELRTRAEEKLGERFDLRAFHDVVLSGGSLPVDVLERRIDRWISRR